MRRILTLLLLLVFIFPSTATALTQEQKKALQLHIRYFNTEEDILCTSSGGSINLIGNDNQEKIYRFFVQKGLTPAQAAGVTGNAGAESTYNPLSQSTNYQGIFQWDKKVRWARLVQQASAKGQNPDDLSTQLEFAWEEATQRGNIAGLQQYNDVDNVAWYWGRFFEVAIIGGSTSTTPLTNVQALDKRIRLGAETLALYGSTGGTPTTPAPTTPDPSAPVPDPATTTPTTTCVGAGQNTQYVDGFTVYSQYDPQWVNKPYGSSTIGESGCGPSAMAMIITNLTGRPVTPVETASYAASKSLYQPGVGSSWSIAPVLAEHWGLRSEPVVAGVAEITAALQAGKLVIAGGTGPLPFTAQGHIIVIRAVTADGKWKVGDSAHTETNNQSWDPQQILSSMKGKEGSVYAISK